MWREVTLADIFTIARGGSPRPIDTFITDDVSGINWIMIGDASEGSKYIESTKKKIRPEGASRSRMVYPGDFLLTNSMSFGKPYILKTSGCIHDGWLVLSPKSDQIHPDYFYYLLGSPLIYSEFKKLAAGAVVKNLNIELAKSLNVRLPPLDDQKRIAHLLGKVEGLIAQRKQHLQQLDALLKSVFLEMFGDPLKNEKGWGNAPLANVCIKITDGTHDTPERIESGMPFITGKHIRPFAIDYKNADYVSHSDHIEIYKRCDPKFGDILYTNIGVNLCTAAMNTVNYEFSMKNVALLRPDPTAFSSRYIEHYLNYNRTKQNVIGELSSGGAQKFLGLGQIQKILVRTPPLPLQNQFAAVVEKAEGIKSRYQKSITDLEALYGALSQKAFAGELDLSQVPFAPVDGQKLATV